MVSVKNSLDQIFSSGTTVGISNIDNMIVNDISPILENINLEVDPILNIGVRANNSLSQNMNCSFVKEILDEMYPELISMSEEVLLTTYFSLTVVLLLLAISLGSFILSYCFKRVNKIVKKSKK